MQTLSRVYDTYDQAHHAVEATEAAGFPGAQISLVANKYVSTEFADVEETSAPATGAGIGGVLGGSAGLFAGLGLLAIPGPGPVVAGNRHPQPIDMMPFLDTASGTRARTKGKNLQKNDKRSQKPLELISHCTRVCRRSFRGRRASGPSSPLNSKAGRQSRPAFFFVQPGCSKAAAQDCAARSRPAR